MRFAESRNPMSIGGRSARHGNAGATPREPKFEIEQTKPGETARPGLDAPKVTGSHVPYEAIVGRSKDPARIPAEPEMLDAPGPAGLVVSVGMVPFWNAMLSRRRDPSEFHAMDLVKVYHAAALYERAQVSLDKMIDAGNVASGKISPHMIAHRQAIGAAVQIERLLGIDGRKETATKRPSRKDERNEEADWIADDDGDGLLA